MILRFWFSFNVFSIKNFLQYHYSDVIMENKVSSNHQPYYCLLTRLFGSRSNDTFKLRVTSRCSGNAPVTSNAENVSIWWRHRDSSRHRPLTVHSWLTISGVETCTSLVMNFIPPSEVPNHKTWTGSRNGSVSTWLIQPMIHLCHYSLTGDSVSLVSLGVYGTVRICVFIGIWIVK